MLDISLTTVAVALVSGLLGGGLVSEIYKAKAARLATKEKSQSDASQAQISAQSKQAELELADRQSFSKELYAINRELLAAEKRLIDDMVVTNRQLDQAQRDKERAEAALREQKRETDEQKEEALSLQRVIASHLADKVIMQANLEAKDREILRLERELGFIKPSAPATRPQ